MYGYDPVYNYHDMVYVGQVTIGHGGIFFGHDHQYVENSAANIAM